MTENELATLVAKISTTATELRLLQAKLKRECHHPTTRLTEQTRGGDWDDPIYVERCTQCVYCGAIFHRSSNHHLM